MHNYYLVDGSSIPFGVANTFNRILHYAKYSGAKEITHTIANYRGTGKKVFTYAV